MQQLILKDLSRIKRFAYTLTQDHHDTDDLLQALVEKVLAQSIPLDVKPLPWMLKMAKNLWIDELRKRKTKGIEIPAEDAHLGDTGSTEQQLEKDAQLRAVNAAIGKLPEAQRVVLGLVMSAEMSYAEAAAVLDVPIGTVMSRLARAREALAKMLEEEQ